MQGGIENWAHNTNCSNDDDATHGIDDDDDDDDTDNDNYNYSDNYNDDDENNIVGITVRPW